MDVVRLPVGTRAICAILSAAFLILGCSRTAELHGVAIINVQPRQINFGDVLADGATLWSKVTLKNDSSFAIKIDRNPSIRCAPFFTHFR